MIYVKSPLRITLVVEVAIYHGFIKSMADMFLQLQLINLYIYLVLDVHMIIKYG